MQPHPGFDVDARTGVVTLRQAAPLVQASAHVPAAAPRRRAAVPSVLRRGYAAAEVSNLTASFTGETRSLNEDLEHSLRLMVGRSRQLAKNNNHVAKFLRMVQNHLVGPKGVQLNVLCRRPDGTIDDLDRAVVEDAFKRFSKRGVIDVTGRLSRTQLERLLVLCWARDGEYIVRRVKGRQFNRFGYALQIIDPVLLDYSYRADFNDGRRIRLGVETDPWGRPIAYHFRTDVENVFGGRRERVPADEIWHHFTQLEPNQVRGVPWIHSAMRTLNDIGGYTEAAIIAARVGASNMGFFIPPAGDTKDAALLAHDTQNVAGDADQDGQADAEPELVRDATPGGFDKLPPGYSFESFDPDYPHANFEPFMKAMLRGVASGIGVDYNTLNSDLEGVNFSSMRGGVLETRDEWMCLQGSFEEAFHQLLFPEWLEMAFVSGELGRLPVSKFDKYNAAEWQFRRWPWVDPLKDFQATEMEISAGMQSFTDAMRERGRDPERVWAQLEQDLDRIEKIRKRLKPAPPPAAAPASPAGAAVSGPKKPDDEDDDETD